MSFLPAALIPYCSYQNQTNNLSQRSTDFGFPVCSKFEPTIWRGQLCYSLDLSKHANFTSKSGEENSLFLIVDPTGFLSQEGANKVKIHLDTLGQVTLEGEGKYYLSSLKQMTATKSFLELSDHLKGCSREGFEECQVGRFMSAVQKQCGCVPWALPNVPWKDIGDFSSKPDTNSYCLLDKYNCTKNITMKSLNCNTGCTGLYTDVFYEKDNIGVDSSISLLLEEYKTNRRHIAKNIKFDPRVENLSMILPRTFSILILPAGTSVEKDPQVVKIFFDTALYDQVKVSLIE